MDKYEAKCVIEGILFASGEPIELERIANALEMEKKDVEKLLEELTDTYNFDRRGIKILKLETAYQMATRPEYIDYIRTALDTRRDASLSKAALEVLAIAAYNQPVTRGYIEQVRGVSSDVVINNLVDKGLLREVGRLDVPGRPRVFGTTPEFLRVFALSSLRDMPEFEQQDLEQMDLLLPSDAASEQELEQYKNTLAAASEAQGNEENVLTRPMTQTGLE